jgi:hypothetical protein
MHANDTASAELVLDRLPSGELAWLKPEDDEPRYTLTDLGRRELALAQLFDPSPAVADVAGMSRFQTANRQQERGHEQSRPARCPACGQSQDTPDCDRREHWGVA